MYERHFGFREKPFNLTPDSRYLFLSLKHQEAFGNLQFGVAERTGFLLLTGEVGTGKTTLIRHFLSQVGPDVRTAVVLYPALSAGELFHAILQDLGVAFAGGTLKDAVDALHRALIDAKAQNLKVVVLIDEAQNLKPHVLEQLRLLSNLETEREKLMTLVLVGQPELREVLERPALRQLAQRITSRTHLEPLSSDETRAYIKHRLSVAGGRGSEVDDSAIKRIHELSGGIPRLVNVLCDRALVGAFARAASSVDLSLVKEAAREVLPSRLAAESWTGRGWLEVAGLFLLGVLIVGSVRYFGSNARGASATPVPAPSAPGSAPSPVSSPTRPSVSTTEVAMSPNGIRCASPQASRTAAIAAIEGSLGTPGFDSAAASVSFEQWRAIRLPAIAHVRGVAGSCEVAILPVDEKTTRVTDDTGEYSLGNAQLKAAYEGTAILCFVDRDTVLAKPERARVAWARRALERHGLLRPGSNDAAFADALAKLGARVGAKESTSVEGPALAALYALDGPRLAAKP